MAKRVRVRVKKYNGDDCYSWAVFKDGRPVYTGCSRGEARYYQSIVRERLGEK